MTSTLLEEKAKVYLSAQNAKLLLAGGIAGCVSKTTVAPLDRCKILLQTHHHHFQNFGLLQTIKSIHEKEGVLGFYRSNGAQMLRIFPYAATQFFSYEQYKQLLKNTSLSEKGANIDKLCAGSMAGITSVLLTYPLDVVRARLAFQLSAERIYVGISDAFSSILQREGIPGLYRGIVPSLIGMAPYAGMSFYTFETLKEHALRRLPHVFGKPAVTASEGAGKADPRLILTIPGKLLCGSVAGAFAQTTSYPLDVVRRQMQVANMVKTPHESRSSWVRTLVHTYREFGLKRGLYRGLSVTYLRACPQVAVSFATYESLKQLFDLDTSS